jgi:hypothetical protein
MFLVDDIPRRRPGAIALETCSFGLVRGMIVQLGADAPETSL